MLDLMLSLDMPAPPHKREVEAMLITYRLTKDKVVNEEQASIIVLAWRCLYAEIVKARVDGVGIRLQSARLRCIKMLQSRAEAYVRKWELWVKPFCVLIASGARRARDVGPVRDM